MDEVHGYLKQRNRTLRHKSQSDPYGTAAVATAYLSYAGRDMYELMDRMSKNSSVNSNLGVHENILRKENLRLPTTANMSSVEYSKKNEGKK